MRNVVLDTCILVAALRSAYGASFRVIELMLARQIQVHLTDSLVWEYRAVLSREGLLPQTPEKIAEFIRGFCNLAVPHRVYFQWRPHLSDSGDDRVLEAAINAGCDTIVTHNVKDFVGAASMNVRVLTPAEFLREIGEAK